MADPTVAVQTKGPACTKNSSTIAFVDPRDTGGKLCAEVITSGLLKNTDAGVDVRICGPGTEELESVIPVDPTAAPYRNQLYIRELNTGERCLDTLPPPFSDCVCDEKDCPDSTAINPAPADTITRSCQKLILTHENTSAWPVWVKPRFTLIGYSLESPSAVMEAACTVDVISPDGERVTVESTVLLAGSDNGAWDTGSLTVDLDPVCLKPGEIWQKCLETQVRFVTDVETVVSQVTWGTMKLCADLASKITPETIADLVGETS